MKKIQSFVFFLLLPYIFVNKFIYCWDFFYRLVHLPSLRGNSSSNGKQKHILWEIGTTWGKISVAALLFFKQTLLPIEMKLFVAFPILLWRKTLKSNWSTIFASSIIESSLSLKKMCSVLLNRTHHILISDHILALKSTAYLGRYF